MTSSNQQPAATRERTDPSAAVCPCPSCGGATRAFFSVDNAPVNSCVLLGSAEEAQRYPRGRVELVFCEGCGFIGNAAFDPSLVSYDEAYEDQQSFSPTFNRFAEGLARELVETYDLHRRKVVEIGCGKGDFLVSLCRFGDSTGVGIDPAWIEGRAGAGVSGVRFIRDVYSSKHGDIPADLVCCRHTLEHIPDVGPFVRSVSEGVARRSGTLVFFEVPDVVRVLEDAAFWDVYYEHCSYFSPGSLARLFRASGFQTLALRRAFGDQYLLLEARRAHETTGAPRPLEEPVEQLSELVDLFSRVAADAMHRWAAFVRGGSRQGRRIAVWGSGSKCVAFLTSLGLQEEVNLVVDINPFRQGLHIPGTGHVIHAPEDLVSNPPDVVLVMNGVYEGEIRETLAGMGLSPAVVPLGGDIPSP